MATRGLRLRRKRSITPTEPVPVEAAERAVPVDWEVRVDYPDMAVAAVAVVGKAPTEATAAVAAEEVMAIRAGLVVQETLAARAREG
jgi:hypothetical protein